MDPEEEVVRCCASLLSHSSSPSRQWQDDVMQLETAVKRMGPVGASPILLSFLRRPSLPDHVVDALSHLITLCCGSCSAPPSTLTLTFSPSLSVTIKEMDYTKGGLGWKVWGAALVLSWRLLSMQKSFQGKRVLELGSGCGLCGLLVAKLGASEVLLTDHVPDILANLCNNALLLPAVVQNCTHTTGRTTSWMHYVYARGENSNPCVVQVGMLDWAKDAPMSSLVGAQEVGGEKFDWIIGSDLIYNQYSTQFLVAVIERRLAKPHGQGIFAAPIREHRELDLFLAELNARDLVACVEHCTEEEWRTCMMAMLGTEREEGTLHGVDHYEGGLVIIRVSQKPQSAQVDTSVE